MKRQLELDLIRVVHYNDEHISDPFGDRQELSSRDYNTARNHLLAICARHGTSGPGGQVNIEIDEEESEDEEDDDSGCDDPEFWIIEDQLNYERYLYLEICNPKKVTRDWLLDVMEMGEDFPGWGICVANVRLGYLIILPPMLLVWDRHSSRRIQRKSVWRC